MNYETFIRELLIQVKQGIDDFNKLCPDYRAHYPEMIDLTYEGVRMLISFTGPSDEQR